MGPYDLYKWRYGAPIDGRKYMGNWGYDPYGVSYKLYKLEPYF